MKIRLFVFILVAIMSSCYTPGQYPPPMKVQALDEMDAFRNYFLQGRLCDAAVSFGHAVDLYARLDDMCALADAHIQMYLFHAYIDRRRDDLLDRAAEFASTGECGPELKRIEELRAITPDSGLAIQPDSAPNDIFRSVMLRKAAVAEKERRYVEEALRLDRSNGWIVFVLRDLDILSALSGDPVERDRLRKRMEFLSSYIQECDQ